MYVIEVSGGHLKEKRYIHPSGLTVSNINGAERYELCEALKLIRENVRTTQCKLKAKYVTTYTNAEKQRMAVELDLLTIMKSIGYK